MVIMDTKLNGCKNFKPTLYADARGSFFEVWRDEWLPLLPGASSFVQDNHSLSRQGVLRGLHFQVDKPQGKLVRVVEGAIFDVAVDVRPDSSTFGQWVGYELSAENGYQMRDPARICSRLLCIKPTGDHHKCTDYYDPTCERAICWDDPTLAIEWPLLPGV